MPREIDDCLPPKRRMENPFHDLYINKQWSSCWAMLETGLELPSKLVHSWIHREQMTRTGLAKDDKIISPHYASSSVWSAISWSRFPSSQPWAAMNRFSLRPEWPHMNKLKSREARWAYQSPVLRRYVLWNEVYRRYLSFFGMVNDQRPIVDIGFTQERNRLFWALLAWPKRTISKERVNHERYSGIKSFYGILR
jgi:hypothetical protein